VELPAVQRGEGVRPEWTVDVCLPVVDNALGRFHDGFDLYTGVPSILALNCVKKTAVKIDVDFEKRRFKALKPENITRNGRLRMGFGEP
jgi:hypothetical protein